MTACSKTISSVALACCFIASVGTDALRLREAGSSATSGLPIDYLAQEKHHSANSAQLADDCELKPLHIMRAIRFRNVLKNLEVIKERLQARDYNKKGMNYKEFLTVLRLRRSPMIEAVFHCFDLDSEGAVERKEFFEVLSGFTQS